MHQSRQPLPEWVTNVDPAAHGYTSYSDRSMERDQLDRSLEVTEGNVEWLYSEYTPAKVEYQRGSRPLLETIVDKVCAGLTSDRDKALALVRWRRANYRHLGKCGLGTEEEIILGGYSMCHDASRSLIILAQVAGLGSRMIIGLNDTKKTGHTLTEVCIDGKWSVIDPSPCLPYASLERPDGSLMSGWDVRQHPEWVRECPVEYNRPNMMGPDPYADLFANYRLVNYTLQESMDLVMQRFLYYVAAHKAIDNYDYQGHLDQTRLSAFLDFDKTMDEWLKATLGKRQK